MDDFPNFSVKNYDDVRNDIRSGDILLCSGNSIFSNMIKTATQSVWSHVAFILRLDIIDRIMVLESVESIGVRAVPLSSYARDYNGTGAGYPGRIMIARHNQLQQKNIPDLSKTAVDRLGYPYNPEECARIAARISANSIGLKTSCPDVQTGREFICSEYAELCFKSVGITVDYNPMGFIAPADFARCKEVSGLFYIQTGASTPVSINSMREHIPA